MYSVDHAMTVIGEKLRISNLALNDKGQVELVLADKLTAYVTRISQTTMELSFRLPRLVYARPSTMRAMLTANFLGAMTGPGRLAIDPVKEEVIYCERWDIASMAADDIDRRLTDFIAHGAYWLTKGSDDLIELGHEDILGLNLIFPEESDEEEATAAAFAGLDRSDARDQVMIRL